MNGFLCCGSVYSDNYLAHHGIMGQKLGIRRYQNQDGTLTPEGKRRYGKIGLQSDSNSGFRRFWGRDYGPYTNAKRREDRVIGNEVKSKYYKKLADTTRKDGNGDKKTEKMVKKYEKISQKAKSKSTAQDKRNLDIERRLDQTSTNKLALQRILFGSAGARTYRSVRARDKGRVKAALSAVFSTPVNVSPLTLGIGVNPLAVPFWAIRKFNEKKKYGDFVI